MENPQSHLQQPPNHGDMMGMLQKPYQQIPSLPLPSAQLNSAFQPPAPQQQTNQLNSQSAFNPIQPSALQRPPQFNTSNNSNMNSSQQFLPPSNNMPLGPPLQQQPQPQPQLQNNNLNRPYQPSPTIQPSQQQQQQQGPPTSNFNNLNQHMSNLNLNNSNIRNESPFTVQSQQPQVMMPSYNSSFPPQMSQPTAALNKPLQHPPQQTQMYGQQMPFVSQPPLTQNGMLQSGQSLPGQLPPGPGAFTQPPQSIRPGLPPSQQYPSIQPLSSQQQPFGMTNPPGSLQSGPYPQQQQPQIVPPQPGQYPGGPSSIRPPFPPQTQPQPGQQPYTYQQQQQNQQFQQPPQPQQQQSKMDLDQIPNPIEVSTANNSKFSGEFETNEAGKIPPLITTDFICKDMGNCNPRFMRSSVYSVPANPDLLKQSKLPLVLNLTPFAELRPEEREPPVSNLGELGPVRCKRCKAYMSPFMKFIDNGKKFSCPFCEDVTLVPQEYFNHLDHMGRRVDMYERPELCLGSYEFVATKDYCRQQTLPQPPAFIFMIDVSVNSIRSGLLHVLCPYIKNFILPNLPVDKQNQESQEIRVGFVTYDKELHFYNLKHTLAAPQMMIVSDIEEVFVPILDGFLVKLSESKTVIDILLDTLPTMFDENKETELILGPVIEAGLEALKAAKISGKLFIFHSNLPNAAAPGQLKNRDDKKLLGTDKEKQVLTPQNDYYGQLAKKCLESGCCVDFFLLPNQYCDLASISDLNKKSGGQLYKYDFFTADTQGQRLCEDLTNSIQSTVAFDAVMKIRTSTGIKPVDYLGNFNMYGNDVELAGLQKQTSLSVELKHEDKLNENSIVYIQLALLYTSLSGQRRIRIHNLSLSVCTQYNQMFSSCELDTLINYIAKLACRSVTVSNPKSIKENLVLQIASILASYRKNCTNTPSKGQFILPETLKLLPVFSNSLLKSDAISGSQNVSVDERAFLMHRLMSMDIESTYSYFYPRVLPLHQMETPEDFPQPVRCIYERLQEDGIYLLENGLIMYLWLGANVDPSVIQNLFGVAGTQQLNTEKCKLLELNTKISENVRSVIKTVNEQRKSCLKLIVVRQRDNLEIFFKNLLVEDKGHMPNGSSYVDFLYQLHREIKNILS